MVRLVAAVLLACLPLTAKAEDAGNLRKFADSLFANEDYFRAQTEYRRLLAYYPSIPDAGEIEFKAAQCSFKAGRFTEAVAALGNLAAKTSSMALADKCRITAAASLYKLGDHAETQRECTDALEKSPSSGLKDRFLYLSALSLMQRAQWEAAGRILDSIPPESGLAPSARDLSALALHAGKIKPRSPFHTGLLSAAVPGLGQVTCGYVADGLAAMALSSACLASGIVAQRNGNHSLAAAGYTLFGIFYSANVYGGTNAARRANRQTLEKVLSRAENLRALSLE